MLLNRGAHAPLGGEFEILRGEVVIGQIVWCQLYNTGFLSFQMVINRDLRLKLRKLIPSIKTLVD